MAAISLERARGGWVDRLRRYTVLIDGQKVGKIGRGQRQVFQVHPGPHQIRLKIDWCWSDPVDVEAHDGSEVQLACRPRANLLTLIYYVSGGYDRYIRLERA